MRHSPRHPRPLIHHSHLPDETTNLSPRIHGPQSAGMDGHRTAQKSKQPHRASSGIVHALHHEGGRHHKGLQHKSESHLLYFWLTGSPQRWGSIGISAWHTIKCPWGRVVAVLNSICTSTDHTVAAKRHKSPILDQLPQKLRGNFERSNHFSKRTPTHWLHSADESFGQMQRTWMFAIGNAVILGGGFAGRD